LSIAFGSSEPLSLVFRYPGQQVHAVGFHLIHQRASTAAFHGAEYLADIAQFTLPSNHQFEQIRPSGKESCSIDVASRSVRPLPTR